MHNGMLRLAGEKMSKSLGNIVGLREAVERWGREPVLLFFMTAHWSKPMDFSDETMAQAAAQWSRLSEVTIDHDVALPDEPRWADFETVLDDDFNTPAALAVINEWQRVGNGEALTRALEVFGLPRPRHMHRVSLTMEVKVEATVVGKLVRDPKRLTDLVRRRFQAREERDFPQSDELRDEIRAEGADIEDTPDGVRLVVPEE
jgi:cysteinyl-tRNA synthetase